MYLKKLRLENIRGFEELEIDLSNDAGIKTWAVLLGENGAGKTTILRCIALTLGDQDSASALLADSLGDWVRIQARNRRATIRAEFHDPQPSNGSQDYTVEIGILSDKRGESIEWFKTSPQVNFPWDRMFACGYGANRSSFAVETYERYRTIDSVYTLFSYSTPLQNPELTLRRILAEGADISELLNGVDEIMMLPIGSTRLGPRGIEMQGTWGRHVPIVAVGDGYRATLSWVIDFLGWAMSFYGTPPSSRQLTGLVLLDEIEQHLHPTWQRRIIGRLAKLFPRVQFIVTTHTPMCVVGTTDLSDEQCSVLVIGQDNDKSVLQRHGPPPRGKRADQILTSSLFGMATTSDDDTKEKIEKYVRLRSSSLNEAGDITELNTLQEELADFIGSRESEFEQLVSEELKTFLRSSVATQKFGDEAVSAELRRQIRLLWDLDNDKN